MFGISIEVPSMVRLWVIMLCNCSRNTTEASGIASWSVPFINGGSRCLVLLPCSARLGGQVLLRAPRPSCEGAPLVKQNLGRECLVIFQGSPKILIIPRITMNTSTAARSFHSIVDLHRRSRVRSVGKSTTLTGSISWYCDPLRTCFFVSVSQVEQWNRFLQRSGVGASLPDSRHG